MSSPAQWSVCSCKGGAKIGRQIEKIKGACLCLTLMGIYRQLQGSLIWRQCLSGRGPRGVHLLLDGKMSLRCTLNRYKSRICAFPLSSCTILSDSVEREEWEGEKTISVRGREEEMKRKGGEWEKLSHLVAMFIFSPFSIRTLISTPYCFPRFQCYTAVLNHSIFCICPHTNPIRQYS